MIFKFYSNNILDSLKPLLFFSKLFGISCFSFKDSDGKLKVYISIVDCILVCFALWFKLTIWIIFSVNPNAFFNKIGISLVFDTVIPFLLILTTTTALSNVCFTLLYRRKFAKTINLIMAFDRKVSKYLVWKIVLIFEIPAHRYRRQHQSSSEQNLHNICDATFIHTNPSNNGRLLTKRSPRGNAKL
jgi:hypothetical protein